MLDDDGPRSRGGMADRGGVNLQNPFFLRQCEGKESPAFAGMTD